MNSKLEIKLGSNAVGVLAGAAFIFLGILSLLARFMTSLLDFDLGHYTWPLFIIVPGVLMFLSAFLFERRTGAVPAVFGGMVTMTGLILMLQNLFDLYASWAYAWALVAPTSIGLAKLLYGALRGIGEDVKTGFAMTAVGGVIFTIFGAFFELILNINGLGLNVSWLCLPTLLIGAGIITLIVNLIPRRNSSAHKPAA
jgi:hypothetical protein